MIGIATNQDRDTGSAWRQEGYVINLREKGYESGSPRGSLVSGVKELKQDVV